MSRRRRGFASFQKSRYLIFMLLDGLDQPVDIFFSNVEIMNTADRMGKWDIAKYGQDLLLQIFRHIQPLLPKTNTHQVESSLYLGTGKSWSFRRSVLYTHLTRFGNSCHETIM